MQGTDTHKAQLDKEEREKLEDVVTDMRERVEANERYERCADALEQIDEFEDAVREISREEERDLSDEHRELADSLADKVREFREETKKRLDTLDDLRDMMTENEFEETFSPGFWDKVNEWRDEWIDALEDLERACEEYAKPNDEPVEAHLYDLFDYFNWRLKGSDHYSSSGILFMTYYFEREGGEYTDEEGEPNENLGDKNEKLALLASRLDDYKSLADEVGEDCDTLDSAIHSEWSDRALSEITTTGYDPNRKHGVAINIQPLADGDIVPEIVEDKVVL
jgi:hypothetical protein